jgi:hypothetical protein
MLINQLHKFMRFIDPAGRRVNPGRPKSMVSGLSLVLLSAKCLVPLGCFSKLAADALPFSAKPRGSQWNIRRPSCVTIFSIRDLSNDVQRESILEFNSGQSIRVDSRRTANCGDQTQDRY